MVDVSSFINDLAFYLFQGCGKPPAISDKSKNIGDAKYPAGNTLKNDNTFWAAKGEVTDGNTRCQFIIDLGCARRIRGVKLRNNYAPGSVLQDPP